ncbi:MAG: hypothetical protein KGZ58_02420 [Ignavibacteriales bacterium]|nr:hypothetical protein [Ignavibacteriales bacterium]
MATHHFIPRRDIDFLDWYRNFAVKIVDYAPAFGISAEVLAQIQSDLDEAITMLKEVHSLKQSFHSKTEAKKTHFKKARRFLLNQVGIMKRQNGYAESIGKDLGIISTAQLAPKTKGDDAKPKMFITLLPDKNRIDWIKGENDGIMIQSKRGEETVFTFLDKDTRSPYDDARKNLVPGVPEKRTYRFRYFRNDIEVGEWSDEVTVVCAIE